MPEIQRCSLSNVILQMLSIGITDIAKFNFLEAPPQDAIDGALRQLQLLGAAVRATAKPDEGSCSWQLTPLGKQMAAFPLDPKFTKGMVSNSDFSLMRCC